MQGHIRQRGDTWTIVVKVGEYPNGRPRYKWHGGFKTKKEAQRELTRILNEMNTGAYVEPSRMTVALYLDRWLADYAKTNVSAKTYEGYEEFIQKHLVPTLGHYLLAKLTPLHIQAYYSKALQTGRRDGKGGLSPQTVLHHHRVLREAMQQAVKWQLLARNPVDAVQPPKPQRKEMKTLDEEETIQLLEATKGTLLHIPVLVAAATGMRRGEILALRWEDVDLKAGVLSVCQSLEETAAGLSFKQPKTAKSRRVVDLPPMLVEALVRHKSEQANQRLQIGAAYENHGLVVAREDGRPVVPSRLSITFGAFVKKTGRVIRFHDLRHTHASVLLKKGIHPKVVSERLGHSNIGITLDTYSHVMPGMGREAALRFDEALRAAPQSNQNLRLSA